MSLEWVLPLVKCSATGMLGSLGSWMRVPIVGVFPESFEGMVRVVVKAVRL